MTLLAYLTALVLVVVAAVLVVWAIGLTWPFDDEARLARANRRAPNPVRLPPAAVLAFLSVIAMFAAALAIWLAEPHGPVLEAIGWLTAALFLLRGASAYVGAGGGVEFRRYDRRIYGPGTLALALAFVLLTVFGR